MEIAVFWIPPANAYLFSIFFRLFWFNNIWTREIRINNYNMRFNIDLLSFSIILYGWTLKKSNDALRRKCSTVQCINISIALMSIGKKETTSVHNRYFTVNIYRTKRKTWFKEYHLQYFNIYSYDSSNLMEPQLSSSFALYPFLTHPSHFIRATQIIWILWKILSELWSASKIELSNKFLECLWFCRFFRVQM